MKAALLVLLLPLAGCAGWQDMGHEDQTVHVRPCAECYYTNDTDTYQSIYMPDGRIIPILPHKTIDLDELGIRNYTITEHTPRKHYD